MNEVLKDISRLDDFVSELCLEIPTARVIDNYLSRSAFGSDASFYRLVPALIVEIDSLSEMQFLIIAAYNLRIPITFRAAGTSLSGQAVTDSVLVLLTPRWRTYDIYNEGKQIRLDPGVTGGEANKCLEKHSRKIGPDPASLHSAKIGGIAANNASGMCCGTKNNSYKTLVGLKVVFPDGVILNTLDEFSRDQFRLSHGNLLSELIEIRGEILGDKSLLARIEKKYEIKNTTGYSLNAFTDYDDGVDILQHLIIGSEGTLGFIASITYETVESLSHQTSALVIFNNTQAACDALPVLRSLDVNAVELIDGAGLLATRHMAGFPALGNNLTLDNAALLIDVKAASMELLEGTVDTIRNAAERWLLSSRCEFTFEKSKIDELWAIRKGLFPAISARRPAKSTIIIEDVAFPLPSLALGVADIQKLLIRYEYHDAAIFGHALDGNIHFVFSQEFGADKEIQRYQRFMDDLAQLVVGKYEGSLKAEHGTGRNIAPFVEMEWGSQAYAIMCRLKTLIDPLGIFNPGVILNKDLQVHIKNLKDCPSVNKIVDSCIECGFCEPTCPSKDLSFTPRSRITALREMARIESSNDQSSDSRRLLKKMRKDYAYQGDVTCAACGLCEVSCPADINMADMTRSLRTGNRTWGNHIAALVAKRFEMLCVLIRLGLGSLGIIYRIFGKFFLSKFSAGLNFLSAGYVPRWNKYFPRAVNKSDLSICSDLDHSSPSVVYFPSCVSRTMGTSVCSNEKRSSVSVMIAVLERANFNVILPEKVDALCCGMPMDSKGFASESENQAANLIEQLLSASDNGKIPVVVDTSPCTQQILKRVRERDCKLELYDTTTFLNNEVLPRLEITPVKKQVALHAVCSSARMGTDSALVSIAKKCATQVVQPLSVSCCGFAGDKGFTVPELNSSALKGLASEVSQCVEGFSSSRTCEIGLSFHSGIEYKNIVYLIDEASTA